MKLYTKPANRVILTLVSIIVIALFFSNYVGVAINRIAPYKGLSFLQALGLLHTGITLIVLLIIAILALKPSQKKYYLMGILCSLLLCFLPFHLSWAIQHYILINQDYARINLTTGFWSLLLISFFIKQEINSHIIRYKILFNILITTTPLCILAAFLYSGKLSSLALLKEYTSYHLEFWQALLGHLILVIAAIGLSIVISTLLIILTLRIKKIQASVFSFLNLIQTVPSLALFGLLVIPLSYLANHYKWLHDLGIKGIGWAPAVIAISVYSLLPFVRNTVIALQGIPHGITESAQSLGMSKRQILFQIHLPFVLPIIIEGLRISSIQAIGLTILSDLIGAMSLGHFIFQGLGQGVMSLILLGAIPTILLALAADAFFSNLKKITTYHMITSHND